MKPIHTRPFLSSRCAAYLRRLLLSFSLLLSIGRGATAAPTPAPAADTLRVRPDLKELFIEPAFYSILEDASGRLTLPEVREPARDAQFVRGDQLPTSMEHPGAAYWLRLTVQAQGPLTQHWYLELFDSHLNDILFYPTPLAERQNGLVHTGADYPLASRKFPYKNFLFRLPLTANQAQTYYLRLRSNSKTTFLCRLRTEEVLAEHFQAEYGLLGAFYGVLLIMLVYNLCLYLFVGEQTYLRYVLYVLSCSLVFLSEDGLGFEYLWPNFPTLNQLVIAGSPILLLFTFSYYARHFLDTAHRLRRYDPWLRRVVLASVAILLLDTMWLHSGWGFWFYLLPYGVLYYAAVQVWRQGFRPARFFLLAHALVALSVGFLILRKLGINTFTNTATVYSMNVAFVIEVVVLSYALGEKIKAIKDATIRAQDKMVKQLRKKHLAQNMLVEQLRQNQELKDQLNSELEDLVARRTAELHQQNQTVAAQNHELLEANSLLALQSAAIETLNAGLSRDLHAEKAARIEAREVDFGEFSQIYPDKDACLRYLADLKWAHGGYRCRKCGHEKSCEAREPYARRCTRCRYVESATAGTLLQKCKFSIVKALYAVFLLHAHKGNYSSSELARALELRQATSWAFAQKVLAALQRRRLSLDYEGGESWTHVLLDASAEIELTEQESTEIGRDVTEAISKR